MNIEINVTTDTEFVVFHASCPNVETAVQELYRFEKHVLPKIGKPDDEEPTPF